MICQCCLHLSSLMWVSHVFFSTQENFQCVFCPFVIKLIRRSQLIPLSLTWLAKHLKIWCMNVFNFALFLPANIRMMGLVLFFSVECVLWSAARRKSKSDQCQKLIYWSKPVFGCETVFTFFTFLVGQNLEGRMNKQLCRSGEGCCKIEKGSTGSRKRLLVTCCKQAPEVFLLLFSFTKIQPIVKQKFVIVPALG